MELYRLEQLSFAYPKRSEGCLHTISCHIAAGEFVLLAGRSGCGKTTLLRQLKSILTPAGTQKGQIFFKGRPLGEWDNKTQAANIGFVLQSPEDQVVCDTVWHELAFGLENLGLPTSEIRLRVAEIAAFFGIEPWFHRSTLSLSGGQKQLLNLAAALAMQPDVLLLDEPSAQLDPIAASAFFSTLSKIRHELGTTILLSEHRLEEALPYANRLLLLEDGALLADGPPKEVATHLRDLGHKQFLAMPTPMRVWAGSGDTGPCPLSVQEGRTWLQSFAEEHPLSPLPPKLARKQGKKSILECRELSFRYEKEGKDVLDALSLSVPEGGIFALLGGNGAGKSSLLALLAGQRRPQRGKILLDGTPLEDWPLAALRQSIAVLPQRAELLFVRNSLAQDFSDLLEESPLSAEARQLRIEEVSVLCELEDLLQAHPLDLSGGELQRAALAKLLLQNPRILLLDEPTKGMDAHWKECFAAILQRLQEQGRSIFLVSHDIEFCARFAERCALLFDGSIVAEGASHRFFAGNHFYTTAANRMARPLLPEATTVEDLLLACTASSAPSPASRTAPTVTLQTPENAAVSPKTEAAAPQENKKRPLWRMLSGISLLLLSLCALYLIGNAYTLGEGSPFYALSAPGMAWQQALAMSLALLGVLVAVALLMSRMRQRSKAPNPAVQPIKRPALSGRTRLVCVLSVLLIPLTIALGLFVWGEQAYYFICLLVLLEAMLPFVFRFEGRRPPASELALLAVICALGVAGRAAFFWLPQFKPLIAIVMVAGLCFGGTSGFLVGAMTAFVSGFFFGQGPWTLVQMFALGSIGALTGVLFSRCAHPPRRLPFALLGGAMALLLYGPIMDAATVLLVYPLPTPALFAASFLMGLPFNLIHAVASVVFLLLAGPAMRDSLLRVLAKRNQS